MAAHLAQAQAFATDPVKDAAHHLRLRDVNLVTGMACALCHGDIPISIGSSGHDAHRPLLRLVPFTPPAALKHLGSLIFGNHSLDLKQQFVFGRLAQGTVKEYQRDPSPLEFVYQHYLVGVFASQAVWRVNI
jgi:hypothetical protein